MHFKRGISDRNRDILRSELAHIELVDGSRLSAAIYGRCAAHKRITVVVVVVICRCVIGSSR